MHRADVAGDTDVDNKHRQEITDMKADGQTDK